MLNNTLQSLDLSGNNFMGRDLLECFSLHNFSTHEGSYLFGRTPSLFALDLSNNELVGQIPTSLAESHPDFLAALFLDNNNLSGQLIPENFGTFINMFALRLTNNLLNGIIPATIITNKTILLELSYNNLEGDLKTLFSFSSPSSLVVLGLAHNRIRGSIPPFLGNFTPSLRVIDLSHNNLIGNIPQDLYLPSFENVEIISDFDTNIHAESEEISLVIKGVDMC